MRLTLDSKKVNKQLDIDNEECLKMDTHGVPYILLKLSNKSFS